MHTMFDNPAMWKNQQSGPPPKELLDMFKWFHLVFGTCILLVSGANFVSGWLIRKRRARVFSAAVAGLNCMLPFGAVLGVAILMLAPITACQRSPQPVPAPGAGSTATQADTAMGAGDSASDAANVIRAYYQAINDRRYADAYRCWVSNGEASGKSLGAFQSGFANTKTVKVTLGTPGPIEGAAGSRYVEIPVGIIAVSRDGSRQPLAGHYTLRKSVVDGATAEQRAWRFYSAQIRKQ